MRSRRIWLGHKKSMFTMTYSSRRRFVVGGMAITASAGLAGCSGGESAGSVITPTATATATGPVLTAADVSDWTKLVGTAFTIATDSGSKVSATLASIDQIVDASRPTTLARQQPFYASFQMAAGSAPTGGKTYTLSHPSKGNFDLFLGMESTVSGKDVLTALLN